MPIPKSILALTLVVMAGGTTALNAHSDAAVDDIDLDPFRCEIRMVEQSGVTLMETAIVSDTDVSGQFRVIVEGSGGGNRSRIQQGGAFSVGADDETVIGRMQLGSPAMTFDVSLDIESTNGPLSCDERISPLA